MFTKIEREKPEIFHKLHRNLMCYLCLKSVKAMTAPKRQKAVVKMLFSPPNNGKPGFFYHICEHFCKFSYSFSQWYTVKQRFAIFLPSAGMSLTKLSLDGNYLIIPAIRESLVSDIPAGGGKIVKLY
jgi:hypothetical protein